MKLEDKNQKIVNEILTSAQTGRIVCRLANKMNLTPYEAFKAFIKSDTYRIFRTPRSSYSYFGDEAICQKFLNEKNSIH